MNGPVPAGPAPATPEAVLGFVLEILGDVTAGWDVGPLDAGTSLGDLGLESISLVYLVGEIQQRYGLEDLLFQELRNDDRTLVDLRVAELVDDVVRLAADGARRAGRPA